MSSLDQPLSSGRTSAHPLHATLLACGGAVNRLPAWCFSRALQFTLDTVLAVLSVYFSFQLRFDGAVPAVQQPIMWSWMLIMAGVRPLSLYVMGSYSSIWRYFNVRDALVLIAGAMAASSVMLSARLFLSGSHWLAALPLTIVIIDLGMYAMGAGALRIFRRATYEVAGANSQRRLRALIIGNDNSLAAALRQVSVYPDLVVVGLVAPNSELVGLRIGGFRVFDQPSELARLLAAHAVDVVLISDASLECIGATVETATEFGVEVRLLPSAANVIRGDVRVHAKMSPEQAFMDRVIDVTEPHEDVVGAFLHRVVLVTGAGGSIGSEISRQVAALPTSKVILLDQDENSIFERTNELTQAGHGAKIVPLVADIRDRDRLWNIFDTYRPDVILHAAAYKHVPVMEQNCSEAVLNNVTGTRLLAEAAVEFGAERFLMISTDKAVNPTSIMGASKRLAEIVVQEIAARDEGPTRFACVRFGNVVGSRGSVVPIFLRQIAAGGPVTVTDEQMTRYFMTIPEAVQLVLQAATLGSDGHVYMLDMGNPIKIAELARKLIEMSGVRPGKDIEIKFVGMRAGEKLHEQLWSEDAKVSPTSFPRVMAVHAEPVPADFTPRLRELEQLAGTRVDDQAVRQGIMGMPISFHVSDGEGATVAAAN